LKNKLKEKVKNEEYEEAAKLRDLIKEIEKKKK
ncbi:MAG: UvrB/UvrC motif-containing protein, partial [bacterium]|nr:UvrB/UvrC motif-containing protein [bacterium]